MDTRARSEFAVLVYRYAMENMPNEAQRLEMVGGFIETLHPLFGRKR